MSTEISGRTDQHAIPESLSWIVDWLVPAVLALLGLATAVGGAVVLLTVDRDLVAELVADGTIQSDVLTGADLVTVSVQTLLWTGWGLVVTGLALVAAAVLFVGYRRRAERPMLTCAVVGAVVTGLTSFLPFSTVIGGGVAGYLLRDGGRPTATVGAVSGLLAVAPVLLVVAFVFGGLLSGAFAIGEGSVALALASVVVFVVLLAAALSAALGALGGYVGGRLRNTDGGAIEEPPV